MPGDGVSLPTTLAQMGSVAKTQARGQHSSAPVTPFSEQKDGQEELRVQRVKETAATEKNRVKRQEEENDKRKRRRLKRQRKKMLDARQGNPSGGRDSETCEGGDTVQNDVEDLLGSLIDTRV